ncbi:sensor histidine kinase [Streptomyces sp. rh34]|uniref:sensor histidine kinase n=1 Tax=Streptomyces sp. rh34 TaxID=2034272 RepID=UPI000BEF24F7|nr:histidine kinase [Streptomyces sp. rh34]
MTDTGRGFGVLEQVRHRWASGRWRRFDVTNWYVVLGPLLLAASFVPAFHAHGTQVGGVPDRPYDLLAAVAIALQCLPLTVCRRWPATVLALVSAGFAVDQLRGYHSLAGTAFAFALLGVGSRLDEHRHATTLGLSLAYVPLAFALARLGSGEPASEFVVFYLACALVWWIGSRLRSARNAQAERRRRVAEETRDAERTRIARELHDVVTHHVTAMVVQAEAARYLTAAPDRLEEALTSVTATGRAAIADLRQMLDLLDPDHGPGGTSPHSGRLRDLVEQTRRAGQPVEFTEQGAAAEPARDAELVAYRVVREALTNALKYAHGVDTSVRVCHGESEIAVEISTRASGPGGRSPGGSGRGLAGLRERVVDTLGGEFTAGREPGGRFVVRASIPVAGTP